MRPFCWAIPCHPIWHYSIRISVQAIVLVIIESEWFDLASRLSQSKKNTVWVCSWENIGFSQLNGGGRYCTVIGPMGVEIWWHRHNLQYKGWNRSQLHIKPGARSKLAQSLGSGRVWPYRSQMFLFSIRLKFSGSNLFFLSVAEQDSIFRLDL